MPALATNLSLEIPELCTNSQGMTAEDQGATSTMRGVKQQMLGQRAMMDKSIRLALKLSLWLSIADQAAKMHDIIPF